MDLKNYRVFTITFGALPIHIPVPRSYSRKATITHLRKRLTAHYESLIEAGVYDRRGNEKDEIELTIKELMGVYGTL